MEFRQLLIAVVALLSTGSSLMARTPLLQKVLRNMRITTAQPLTIKLIYPDNRIIFLPADQLSLFPALKRIKPDNSCIHIHKLHSATDPFLTFNYLDLRAAIEFVIFMNNASRKTDYETAAMKEITFGNKSLPDTRALIHILHYLEVDQRILDCALEALVSVTHEEESFVHDLLQGSLDLSNRWHPHADWKLLNLSEMGITHVSDIALAVKSIPCDQVEALSLKNNLLDPRYMSAQEIDSLYKLFPRLKQIILY